MLWAWLHVKHKTFAKHFGKYYYFLFYMQSQD